jgi:NADPH2:quinone reductase
LVKNCSVVGFYWGAYFRKDPEVIRRSFEELLGWYGDGLLSPHVSATYELVEVADAMEQMLERRSTGKIVLLTGVTRLGGR